MKMLPRILPLLLAVRLFAAANAPAAGELPDGLYAEFTTSRGVLVAELFYQKVPLTVAHFVGLAEGTLGLKPGTPYYRGLQWYRVVPGFVIQSGNPKAPEESELGYTFTDEFVPGLRHNETGILSMANAGPDTNSAEFFVTLDDCTRLNYLHSVFGRTVRGNEILPQIKADDAFTLRILRIGAAARSFQADAAAFETLKAQGRKYRGETAPGPMAHFDDPSKVLPTTVPRAQYFNYKLNNFQRATGRRLYARVYPAFAATAEQETPAAFTQKLARALGVQQDGVLAVYFATEDQWQVWIGNELMSKFNPTRQRMMDLKNILYASVKVRAAELTEQDRKIRGPTDPITPADLAKFSVDAMLDTLILRLEPPPTH